MILINFSHPLTDEQRNEIEKLTGQELAQIVDLQVQFSNQQPYLQQLEKLMRQLPLDAQTLQTAPILLNLPSLNFIAALVLSEMHGRMGYFPPILRLRPEQDSLPPRYEVAEILNLQNVRETARERRYD